MTNLNPNRFYVYVIFRPDGSPCYVGKGSRNRWSAHEKRAHNPRLRRIMERSKGNVIKVKIREGLLEVEAHAIECALIAAIGRSNKGPLVNMTDGGEGTTGYKRTEEEKLAISIRAKNRVWSAESREKMRIASSNRTHSEETRKKISESNKGKKMSAGAIAKTSAANRGRKLAPEHRAKVSANFKKEKTPEHKAKLRAHMIELNKRPRTEKQLKQMSERMKGKSPPNKGKPMPQEQKDRHSVIMTGRPSQFKGKKHTDAAKKKQSENAKKRTIVRDKLGRIVTNVQPVKAGNQEGF